MLSMFCLPNQRGAQNSVYKSKIGGKMKFTEVHLQKCTAQRNSLSRQNARKREQRKRKRDLHIGDEIKGTGWTKKYPECEYADFYRTGALKKIQENNVAPIKDGSPWLSEVPELSVYDWRGCRMLDKKCWSGKCFQCKWACMANVSIEYNWGVTRKFRFESFCYGPKNCKLYKMGRPRAVPYKGCGSSNDEGWLDEICTENRDDEE